MKRFLLAAVPTLLILTGSMVAMAADPCEENGVVVSITETEMKVRTASGTERSFDLTTETNRPTGLTVGDRVHIDCRDELTDDVALSVHKLQAGEAFPSITSTRTSTGRADLGVDGSVVSVTTTTLVVRTDAGEVRTFALAPGAVSVSLVPGERVQVDYSESGTEMRATNVDRISSYGSRLPDTAGPLPLIGILGVSSLATWIVLRRRSRKS